MRIAIIGMGEVGCTLFEALNTNHAAISYAVDKKLSDNAKILCQKYGAKGATDIDEILDHVDLILSCVEGETAQTIADLVCRHGHKGQVLADFSTAAATTKKQASANLALVGIEYIDVAIMGAIALTGAKTNMIAAGVTPQSSSQRGIDFLKQGGLAISVIANSQAGDAISLKLLRSIFTKGLEALTTECLAAAEYLGVRQSLYDVLADVDSTPLPEFLEMLARTHIVHASRRKKEVQRAYDQISELGLGSIMLPAVEAVFTRTESRSGLNPANDSINTKQALDILIANCRMPNTQERSSEKKPSDTSHPATAAPGNSSIKQQSAR